MTHSGGKAHAVGDQGQQYEVTVYDEDQMRRIVVGWTSSRARSQAMKGAANKRPGWKMARVEDRWKGRV